MSSISINIFGDCANSTVWVRYRSNLWTDGVFLDDEVRVQSLIFLFVGEDADVIPLLVESVRPRLEQERYRKGKDKRDSHCEQRESPCRRLPNKSDW